MEKRQSAIRVLVADDDPQVHEALAEAFQTEGSQVLSAFDGEEALRILRQSQPDAVILDISMPGRDGFQICREIRGESNVPVLILSARTAEYDRLLGLELGADDYITKPFSAREVAARVRTVLRRARETAPAEERKNVSIGNLQIDMNAFQVRLDGKIVPCTPKETEILWVLARNPGSMFSREQLLQRIWGYDYLGDTRAVDSHIKRIRAKLVREGNGWDIRTVWGVGYRLEIKNTEQPSN